MLDTTELQNFPWALVDWLFLNEGEAGDIVLALGGDGTSLPPQHTLSAGNETDLSESAKRALVKISQLRSHASFSQISIVCTLGAAGVLVVQAGHKGQVVYRPAGKLLNPLRDTTGAGDCFTGYFVAGLMRLRESGGEADGLGSLLDECLTVR
jgi:ribokinase